MTIKPEHEYPKQIETLVPDILNLFERPHNYSPENLEWFKNETGKAMERAFLEDPSVPRESYLRMSSIGKPQRQLWYQMRLESAPGSFKPLDAKTRLKFLAGDLIEAEFILLAKEAGHTVEALQYTCEINGVQGHMDCVIDGVAIDVKSASSFSFVKFKNGTLINDDPFGYIAQISGYTHALSVKYNRPFRRGFLAVNKDTIEPTLLLIPDEALIQVPEHIENLKVMLAQDHPPERCYENVVEKNGNITLAKGCNWCPYKEICHGDANGGVGLRVFRYANGLKFLTRVVDVPRVPEITDAFYKYGALDEEPEILI